MIRLVDGSNMLHRELYQPQGKLGVHPLREIYIRYLGADINTIIVWDGPHSLKRRRDIYSGYKQRPEKGEDIKASFELIKEVLCHTGVTQVEIPYWEADDVLYTLAVDYTTQGQEVIIESNDQDFWQLAGPLVKMPMVKPLPCEPEQTCLFKALVGDKSDTIPGWRGFGPARWEAIEDYALVEKALETGDYDAWCAVDWPKGLTPDTETFYNCCNYYKIVRLQKVPESDFKDNYILGKSNPAQAELVFDRWRI